MYLSPILGFFQFFHFQNILFTFSFFFPSFLYKGNVTFSCSESSSVAVTFLSSSGSFLALPVDYRTEDLSIRLQFRTWNQEGLLFSVQLSRDPDLVNLLLQLRQARLLLTLSREQLHSAQVFSGKTRGIIQHFVTRHLTASKE